MLRITSMVLLTAVLAAAASYGTQAETPPILIEYVKVPDEQRTHFLRQQVDSMRPYHEGLLSNGKIYVWYLYEVRYPIGEAAPYNFVVVTAYAERSAHQARERDITYGQFRVGVDGARPTEVKSPGYGSRPAAYASINFLRMSGDGRDAFHNHMTRRRPTFDRFVWEERWMTWALFQRVGPASFEGYDYVVVSRHAAFEEAELSIPLRDSRGNNVQDGAPVLVKAQLWKLLDIVVPQPTASN